MVLTNALYLKAPWADPFEKEATEPEPFHVKGGAPVDVPMMHERLERVGYVKNVQDLPCSSSLTEGAS